MSGGGKGAKSAKAPDYTALAQQQGDINKQTAQQITQANRPNQVDPFGNSVTWSQGDPNKIAAIQQQMTDLWKTGGNNPATAGYTQAGATAYEQKYKALQAQLDAEKNNWTQQQTLNPETKAAWETYMKNANEASSSYGDILNSYLNKYGSPDIAQFDPATAGTISQYDPNSTDKNVSDALYNSVMDRGRVEQGRETDALTSQLRNSGLVPGSEAYNRAMKNLMTSHNDANLLAAQNATLAGGQAAREQYATLLSGQLARGSEARGNYGTKVQGQLAARNQPLQEISGLAGVAGGTPYTPTYQGFSGATGYNPTDLIGAAQAQYSAKQAGANASNSKKGGLLGAGASLGGSYLGSK